MSISITASPPVSSTYYFKDNVSVGFDSDIGSIYPGTSADIRFTDSSSSLIPYVNETTNTFGSPAGGFTTAASGNLVVDATTPLTSVVSTLTGNTASGSANGVPSSATFFNPADIEFVGSNGYITDQSNFTIRRYGRGLSYTPTTATGGTISYAQIGETFYAVHTFTGSGNFTTSSNISNASVFLVGGGGGGGELKMPAGNLVVAGGGGGGGGVLFQTGASIPSGTNSLTVGNGGTGKTSSTSPQNGFPSTFLSYTADGGSFAASAIGGSSGSPTSNAGGFSTVPEVIAGISYFVGGGGGGAGSTGFNGQPTLPPSPGDGGLGLTVNNGIVNGTFGGGGGGGQYNTNAFPRGNGNGGGGNSGKPGTANTGGGGGGAYGQSTTDSGSGGSGFAVVAYPVPTVANVGDFAISTLAGSVGISGLTDGTVISARFTKPTGVVSDGSGNLYIGDQHCIRKIDSVGIVSTIAGNGTPGSSDVPPRFNGAPYLAVDGNTLYVADSGNNSIRTVNLTTFAVSTIATIPQPSGIAYSSGFLYVSSFSTHTIRRLNVSTLALTTIAGSGTAGFLDGPALSARFFNPTGIALDGSGNIYIADSFNFRIRRLSPGGIVSTYAGTGANGFANDLGFGARFSGLRGIRNGYIADGNMIRTFQQYTGVRTSGTLDSNFVIVASQTFPIEITSRLKLITQNPPLIGNTTSLYSFEPFEYVVQKMNPADTMRITQSSAEVLPYATNDGTLATYGTSNGFQNSFANPITFLAEALSNSNVVESLPIITTVSAGRWIPDIGSPYVFIRGQNIGDSYLFSNTLGIPNGNGFTNPSLPVGLSFTRMDTSGYVWKLAGTPSLQTTPTNYQFIGRSATGKIITTIVNITVGPDQLITTPASVSFSNLQIGSNVPTTAITVRKPTTASGNITWTSGQLPDGLYYADVSGNAFPSQSIMTAFDASYTIQIMGAPTETAAQSFRASSNFCNVSLIAFVGTINKTVPLSFQFGKTVLFTNQYTGTPSLFKDVPISIGTDVRYTAFSFFGTPFSNAVSSITANALPDGLSLTPLSASSVRVIGTPTTVSSNVYTITATDASGNIRAINSTIPILQDVMTVFPPLDVSYVFIQSRDLTNPKTGYYSSPITFGAASLLNSTSFYTSSYPITFSQLGLGTSGIGLTTTSNTATLSGIPTETLGTTTLTITANDGVASASRSVLIQVLPEVYTFTPSNVIVFDFLQNEPITPIQFSATTLSERSTQSFFSFNLPRGLSLSPTGLLSGIPIDNGVGTFTISATTGFTSGSNVYSYSTEPDNILALLTPVETTLPLGQVFGPTNVKVISRSGSAVSNVSIQNLDSSYGIIYTSTGTNTGFFSGTMTDGTLATAPLASNVVFQVRGTVGTLTGDTSLTIHTQNADIFRRYLIRNWNQPNGSNGNGQCYIYSQDDGDQTAFTQRYYGFIAKVSPSTQINYYIPSELGITDFQIKYPKLSSYDQSSNTILCARNRNFVVRSTDGITFTDVGGDNGDFSTADNNRRIYQLTYVSGDTWIGIGYRVNIGSASLGTVRVYITIDNGATWNQQAEFASTLLGANYGIGRITTPAIGSIGSTCIRNKNGVLMAGGSRRTGSATNSLLRSTNQGGTWNSVSGQFNQETYTINLEADVWLIGGSDLYIFDRQISVYSIDSSTIRYSTDQGLTWNTSSGDFNFGCLDIVYGEGQWIAYGMSYVAGDYQLQFKYSTNGVQWFPLSPIPNPVAGRRFFTSINVPYVDKIMFDGLSWNIYVMATAPLSPGQPYVRSFRHPRTGDITTGWTEFVIPEMDKFKWKKFTNLNAFQEHDIFGPPGGGYFVQTPGTQVSTLTYVDGNATFYDPKV